MGKKKSFSLVLKILIVGLSASIILVAVLYYVNKTEENIVQKDDPQPEKQYNYEELVGDYKEDVISILDNFDGNYTVLQQKFINLVVPSGFQNFHLNIVVSLDSIVYNNNQALAKIRLEEVAKNNPWAKEILQKVILGLE
ncbi:hypothetical protein K8R66_01545 [bacterium]|nr:hypothetical protein [bacterium]